MDMHCNMCSTRICSALLLTDLELKLIFKRIADQHLTPRITGWTRQRTVRVDADVRGHLTLEGI